MTRRERGRGRLGRPQPSQPDPEPGRLGWLEFTARIVRDRAHTSWSWLRDEELLAAVHARGGVAAYLPGERIGTRDQILLRLAVDPDGHVAIAPPGAPPTAGPDLEDFVLSVLEELRVLAIIDQDTAVGPPGLPADELRRDAERLDADTRQVYAWQAQDGIFGRLLATSLGQDLDLHRDGAWVVAAQPHGSQVALHQPPHTGRKAMLPFVTVDRRGELRGFTYVGGSKDTDVRVHVESGPDLQAAPPPDPHPDTTTLAQWLADPQEARENGPQSPTGVAAPSPVQLAAIDRMLDNEAPDSALAEICSAFEVPELVASLVEVPHGRPDPVTPWRTVSPASRRSMVADVLADASDEAPTGNLPWKIIDRAIYRRPVLGLVLGFLELLLAGGVVAAIFNQVLSWWWWIAVAGLMLLAMDHTSTALIRRHAQQRENPSGGRGSSA